jgi:hypothetical protein
MVEASAEAIWRQPIEALLVVESVSERAHTAEILIQILPSSRSSRLRRSAALTISIALACVGALILAAVVARFGLPI